MCYLYVRLLCLMSTPSGKAAGRRAFPRPWTIWGDVTNVLMCYGHLLWLNIIVCLVCLSMPRGYLCLAQSATVPERT